MKINFNISLHFKRPNALHNAPQITNKVYLVEFLFLHLS